MKNKIKSILKQELTWAFVGLFVCAVFMACGIGLIIVGIKGGAFKAISPTIFICVFIVLLFGFAIFLFIQCLKRLVPYYQSLRALNCGVEDTATMCGHSHCRISHLKGHFGTFKTFYSIHLRFFDNDGNEVIYKTAYNYTSEQFKWLQALTEIKIKRYKKTAVIIEDEDPLDYDFSELPKKLRIKSILVVVLAGVSLALIIVGIICLMVFDYTKAFDNTKWAFGILISGSVMIMISAILKTFIYYETEKFVKNVLPYIRKANRKAKKREKWKEKDKNK